MLFIETKFFSRAVSACLDDEEYNTLQLDLLRRPEQGDIIPGLFGARKLRWGKDGKGKRGGVRIVYYFKKSEDEIWMLALYAKAQKEDLTERDKETLREIVNAIKND